MGQLLKYLKTPILISLQEEFEDITSTRLNKNNLLTKDLSFLEARLLLNICIDKNSYKNIDRRNILYRLIELSKNPFIKLPAYNSLINAMEIEGDSILGLKMVDEAISYAKDVNRGEMFAFLYYLKFLCQYNLGDKDYSRSLDLAIIFASHMDIKVVLDLIESNENYILRGN